MGLTLKLSEAQVVKNHKVGCQIFFVRNRPMKIVGNRPYFENELKFEKNVEVV